VDLVLIAQYSLAPGFDPEWADVLATTVLSPPHLSARALKERVEQAGR
jgi:hypothetical protein